MTITGSPRGELFLYRAPIQRKWRLQPNYSFDLLKKKDNFAIIILSKDMTYHLYRFFLVFIGCLPFRMIYYLSDVLYFLLYKVIGYRKDVVRKNLTESFPEKSEKEILKIEKDFYHSFSDIILETCKMGSMSTECMVNHMGYSNIDELDDVLRSGRSIALFLGHCANWEWVSSMPIHLNKKTVCAQIYHKLSNRELDKIMLKSRAKQGAVNVEMRQTARFINKMVTEDKTCIVGFIADQSPRKKDAKYYLKFLNHEVPVITGPEKIAKHYDFEAWFVQPRRLRRGEYEATFIRMHDNPASLPDFELTDIYYKMLEETIRLHPELYLWTHKRFRYAKNTSNS